MLERKVQSLTGFLLFHLSYGRRRIIIFLKDPNRDPKMFLDHSLFDNPIRAKITENNKLVYESKVKLSTLEIDNKTTKVLNLSLDNMLKFSDSLRNKVLEIFRLYFEAVTEKQLWLQFLLFWIIIERILKIGGKKTDEYIINILIELELFNFEFKKHIIKILYNKRNSIVHEFEAEILQQHRNTMKVIADNLISLLIWRSTNTEVITEDDFVRLIKSLIKKRNNFIEKF